MPLTLKIVSKQRHILGSDSLRVFSVHGGSIGRASDNDWVLPDPDRYISGHHAMIDYRAGAYYLRDSSTNGVYVNQSEQPVGRGAPLRLYDGDELKMGDYVFQVSIVNVSRDGTDDSGDGEPEERPRRQPQPEASPAPLSLKLLGEQAEEMEEAAEERAQLQASMQANDSISLELPELEVEHIDTQVHPDSFKFSAVSDSGFTLKIDDSAEAKANGEAKAVFGSPGRRDFAEAVRLLMECAGLDSTQLPRDSQEEAIIIAGRLIRATAEGLQSVLRSRSLIKAQFRLSQTTIQPLGNNPLKFTPTVQDALEHLFYEHAEGYLGPVEAVEDAFHDLRAHQGAMVKAMQVAFRDLLERLDPDTLEEKFQQGAKRGGLLQGSPKTKYWDRYRDVYRGIASHSEDNFANIVGVRFAETYDREMQQLLARRPKKGEPE
jgi:type VI secretion system protein